MRMRVITKNMLAQKAPSQFRKAFFYHTWREPTHLQKFFETHGQTGQEIYTALLALGDHPRYEDIEALIGTHFTALCCSLCGKDVYQAVYVGFFCEECKEHYMCQQCIQDVVYAAQHFEVRQTA